MNAPYIRFKFNDGGRAAAGYQGTTGDCVVRAIAIASGRPYAEVYERCAAGMGSQRRSKYYKKQRATARNGISVRRGWFKNYMAELGFTWVPTMQIGGGCRVHLREDELPLGRIIVSLSRHYAAVIDGVLHDLSDCSRDGTRCVYGFWHLGDLEIDHMGESAFASLILPNVAGALA